MFGRRIESVELRQISVANDVKSIVEELYGRSIATSTTSSGVTYSREKGLVEKVSALESTVTMLYREIELLVFRLEFPEEYEKLLKAHKANKQLSILPQPKKIVSEFDFKLE